MTKTPDGRIVASAVKQTEAPLVGAPAEYLDHEDGTPAAPREATLKLKHPFRLAGQEYRVLTARKLTGKEIFAVSKAARQGHDPESALFSAMCKISIPAVEALDGEDITALSELTKDFTPQLASTDSEPTGESGDNTQPK